MKTRIATAFAAVVLGTAVPVSSAMAMPFSAPVERLAPAAPHGKAGYWGHHDHPRFTGCPTSSAAEGNANQQHFPVKQYGQTSGGYRC